MIKEEFDNLKEGVYICFGGGGDGDAWLILKVIRSIDDLYDGLLKSLSLKEIRSEEIYNIDVYETSNVYIIKDIKLWTLLYG